MKKTLVFVLAVAALVAHGCPDDRLFIGDATPSVKNKGASAAAVQDLFEAAALPSGNRVGPAALHYSYATGPWTIRATNEIRSRR